MFSLNGDAIPKVVQEKGYEIHYDHIISTGECIGHRSDMPDLTSHGKDYETLKKRLTIAKKHRQTINDRTTFMNFN